MKALSLASVLLPLVFAACGGKVVFDPPGAGGSSSSSSSSAASMSVTGTSVGTGPSACNAHSDCPGGVCLFGSGTCADACDGEFCASCAPGTVCEGCATSSCPSCADCVGACVPKHSGQCDDDDPCPKGEVCIYGSGTCAPACGPGGECPGALFCDTCVTSACCGCENCGSACVGGE